MKSAVTAIARSAVDLLFPSRCVHCGTAGSLFCLKCESEATRLDPASTCRRCALPSPSRTCEACFSHPPALDRAVAVFNYEGPVRDAVYSLKYDDLRAIAPHLGTLMSEALPRTVSGGVDALTPVPVSGKRLRSRGYNQSALLARQVGRDVGLAVAENLLRRVRETPPQARAESEAERRQNVTGAFEASKQAAGMRVLLVDDVMTTGSTLNVCAATLKNAGAKWVGALVLAREL